MNEEMWAELTAQVEEHGFDAIKFLYDDENLPGYSILMVSDIVYEDGVIRVKLA
jgi:hypothetical protein